MLFNKKNYFSKKQAFTLNHIQIMIKTKTANCAAEISHGYWCETSPETFSRPLDLRFGETSFSRDTSIREMQLFMYILKSLYTCILLYISNFGDFDVSKCQVNIYFGGSIQSTFTNSFHISWNNVKCLIWFSHIIFTNFCSWNKYDWRPIFWRRRQNVSCVWLFGFFFRPTRELFTNMEKSPLPVNGCKFWPMLGTHGHWAARVL